MPPSSPSQIAQILKTSTNPLILTGAGVSAASGIPTYRGQGSVGPYTPITWQEFKGKRENRQRYWVRSYVAHKRFFNVEPNPAHTILAKWAGTSWGDRMHLITQNVDSLHHKSGFDDSRMLELHGTLRTVHCMACKNRVPRDDWQGRLYSHNRPFLDALAGAPDTPAPDGDSILEADFAGFQIPECPSCGDGLLRPSVVFFGENLDPEVADKSCMLAKECDVLLAIGTSLNTFSARRLLKIANGEGSPVVIINVGPSKGDDFALHRIDASAQDFLKEIDACF